MKGRILAVDDDPAILEVVRLNLEAEGYEVVTEGTAATALAAFAESAFALAVLDVMLPDSDGFELARQLRERSDIPIIMLSARDSDVDKAVGLGVGADDYVTKPFSPLELVARVKAHLRRYGASNAGVTDQIVESGPVRIDTARRRVTVRGIEVELTAKEFDILRLLAEHPGRVYTKAQIYETVWHEEPFGDLGTVQVHMRRLRTKVEAHPDRPELLTTVWSIGYRFEETTRA
ncbi:MAG TPA: response regulator transcription factor [Coriobacteriia bacterium]